MVLGGAFIVPRWHNWKPLDLAFDLTPGTKVSGTFASDLTTHFLLNLAVKPDLEKTRLHCLMGMELPIENCQGTRQAIHIEWTVSEDGKEIAKGDSTPRTSSYWSDVTARSIGYFKANKERNYTVTAVSLSDGGDLRKLSPRLIVETSPGDYEGFIFLSWLMMYAAIIPLVVAAVILATAWLVTIVKARRSGTGKANET
jgi:hypothetical protein